jgi:hypothetical protein
MCAEKSMTAFAADEDPPDPAEPEVRVPRGLEKEFVPEGSDRLGKKDLRPDEEIRRDDANFRREFAKKLYWLFFGAIFVGPALILAAVLLEMLFPYRFNTGEIIDKATLLATSIIGTVAGVFGTVMGFYYGSEKK